MSEEPPGPPPLPPRRNRSSVPLGLPFRIRGSDLAAPLDDPGEPSGRMLGVSRLREAALEAMAHVAEHGPPSMVSSEQVDFISKAVMPLWQVHLPKFCPLVMRGEADPADWLDMAEKFQRAAAFCYRQVEAHPHVDPQQPPPAEGDDPGGTEGG